MDGKLYCQFVGVAGWALFLGILPTRALGLNPMPRQLVKNIGKEASPQKRAEVLGKNAFEILWAERNAFFKSIIQQETREQSTEAATPALSVAAEVTASAAETDPPPPPISVLYRTILKKNFAYLEEMYGQPVPADKHDELFNAVLEQVLPFADATDRIDTFLAPFLGNSQEVFERLKTIATDYSKHLKITDRSIYGPRFEQFYYKMNLEGGRFQQIARGACANELFRYAQEFLAHEYNAIHKQHPEIETTAITQNLGRLVLQVVLPIASRYGVLWAMLGRFRKNNKESTEDLQRELKQNAPALVHLKPTDQVGETFWSRQAQQVLSDCRKAAHDYVEIFQKKSLFHNLGSPVDAL
ncbi:MAG: hypothetical protein LW808_001975 [Verrucomicrobiota bacterium]|nr:MAG: hypothetical protein LW808_001975 [Verrucomicrobiota bacterium]